MKFGKSYSVLLPSFPQTWQERAVSYNQLKKLINQVVDELSLLGLDPDVLKDLMQPDSELDPNNYHDIPSSLISSSSMENMMGSGSGPASPVASSASFSSLGVEQDEMGRHPALEGQVVTHAVYELQNEGDELVPRLRLTLAPSKSPPPPSRRSSSLSTSPTDLVSPDPPTDSEVDPDETLSRRSAAHDDLNTSERPSDDLVMASNRKFVPKYRHASTLFALQYHHLEVERGRERALSSGSEHTVKAVREPEQEVMGEMEMDSDLDGDDSLLFETPPTLSPHIETSSSPRKITEPSLSIPSPSPLSSPLSPSPSSTSPHENELIIPLTSDHAFYRLLLSALHALSEHESKIHSEFVQTVSDLRDLISSVSRPSSSSSKLGILTRKGKDGSGGELYIWRQIFQLWVDSSIFESTSERNRGERSIEDAEARLAKFADGVVQMGFQLGNASATKDGEITRDGMGGVGTMMKSKESREALERFMQMNVLLLDLRKFEMANREAVRKIMKKHDKRTKLPFPRPVDGKEAAFSAHTSKFGLGVGGDGSMGPSPILIPRESSTSNSLPAPLQTDLVPTTLITPYTHDSATLQLHPLLLAALTPQSHKSKASHGMTLPHLMVVMMTETLLPVIPSIDDYSCLICTSIAYIPIRLQCGHLFCVRCLAKMQKRGQAECPLCRTPCVLVANRDNVDHALQLYMKQWFPREAKQKDKENKREAAFEYANERGLEDNGHTCVIM